MGVDPSSLTIIVISIFLMGIIAQLVADKIKFPSVVTLIIAGIIAGPEVLGIIDPSALGSSVEVIISLAVALVVFKGGFALKYETLKEAQSEAVRLGTVGAILSSILTATAAMLFLGVDWTLALLIGTLLLATGPTVIEPILEVTPIRERVQAALETEGLINDVTAAILSLVVFQFVVNEGKGFGIVLEEFMIRLSVGVFIGLLSALAGYWILKKIEFGNSNVIKDTRIIILGTALFSFGLSEILIQEAGIAAAATAGIILGNLDFKFKDEVKDFEDIITVLVTSFIFVLLASMLSFDQLLMLGLGGILFTLTIMLLIRPFSVILSSSGDRFTLREELYISLVGPRGIIPAGVATFFAISLEQQGRVAAAETLVGAVFLVILATTLIEGSLARWFAKKLDVIPMHNVIVGSGDTGITLAKALRQNEEQVTIIDKDSEALSRAEKHNFTVVQGDARELETLKEAGMEDARLVAAVTRDDNVNLVVSEMAESEFDVDSIAARVNEKENIEAFRKLNVESVISPRAVAEAIERKVLNEATSVEGLRSNLETMEYIVSSEDDGKKVEEFEKDLPEGVIATKVFRKGNKLELEDETTLKERDLVELVGRDHKLEEIR